MRPYPQSSYYLTPIGIGACLSGALLAAPPSIYGQAAETGNIVRIERLEKENQELRKRLEALEGVRGPAPAPSMPTNVLHALTQSTLSGFVTASYFYDTSNPQGGTPPGYLWNRRTDEFTVNKVKVTLASPPAERSGDKWDAAYRTSLMFGQDTPIVNPKSSTVGFENLREAYVELNVPVGTGLNVKFGQLISLLNYESGDGGAVNDNFSQGYQWFYTGNPPGAGVQLGYTFTDWLDVKLRLQNGLYQGSVDNNRSKTFMGAIGIKPNDKIWLSVVGTTGREGPKYVHAVELLGGWNLTPQLHVGTELDYFWFQRTATSGDSPVWSTGVWVGYDFTPKIGAAVRAEFLSDKEGADASGDPLGFAPNTGNDIASVAFTLNLKPLPNIKIQPEIRYDHTSLQDGFGQKEDRVVVGVGASYLF